MTVGAQTKQQTNGVATRGGQMWSPERSRRIVKRIVVEGKLQLLSPAHLGNGDGDDLTDLPLLVDPLDGRPLLTGASIAGALRDYLRKRVGTDSYVTLHDRQVSCDELLFGCVKGRETGSQSPLIVDDAFGTGEGIEMRDGVGLSPETRTAAHDKLFSIETWRAGTAFPVRLELLIARGGDGDMEDAELAEYEAGLTRALVTALTGFEDGGITLGARKRRGYGKVRATDWRVTTYELSGARHLLAWAASDLDASEQGLVDKLGITLPKAAAGLNVLGTVLTDSRRQLTLTATLGIEGAIMIRGNTGKDDQGPDAVHLHSRVWDDGAGRWKRQPIVSGTSLAGALRARGLRICNTLCNALSVDTDRAQAVIDALFGAMDAASRILVEESAIAGAEDRLVQNRIKIDRFTGGVIEGALFGEQPVFNTGQAIVRLRIRLVDPAPYEVDLLLLLLKDLWTGDLPIGGTISIGRGRLTGQAARLAWPDHGDWSFEQSGGDLRFTSGDRNDLSKSVSGCLRAYLARRTR